jgi:protein-tyrosine-phosphatase
MIKVLLVCTANICRSPMAEAILKNLVSMRSDADEWHVESAGVWALSGKPPAILSQFVMEKMGIDISAHQSQLTSLELLQKFDLILTMEYEHKKYLQEKYEETYSRIYMLSEMVGEVLDIPDPIGGNLGDYEEIAYLLEHLLTDGLDRIVEMAKLHQQEL